MIQAERRFAKRKALHQGQVAEILSPFQKLAAQWEQEAAQLIRAGDIRDDPSDDIAYKMKTRGHIMFRLVKELRAVLAAFPSGETEK